MVYPCTFVPWHRVCGAFCAQTSVIVANKPLIFRVLRFFSHFYPTPPVESDRPDPAHFRKLFFLFFQRLSPLFLYVFASVYIFGVSISFRLFCRFMCSGSIYAPVFVRTMDCATELLSRPCEVFFVRFGRFLLFGCGFTCFCGKLRFCCGLVFVLQLMV